MLRASATAATLRLDDLPALDGAMALLAQGVASSLQPANQVYAANLAGSAPIDHGAYPLLFDPQTAGGLLASVPADRAEACLARLHELGYQAAAAIGDVRSNGAGTVTLM